MERHNYPKEIYFKDRRLHPLSFGRNLGNSTMAIPALPYHTYFSFYFWFFRESLQKVKGLPSVTWQMKWANV
jgi:hypothetical protein